MPAPLIRAFQWDIARQVERLDVLLELLPRYAEWGYQELYLHLEDAVAFPSLPQVARRDAYTYKQLGQLVTAAQRLGIGVVPIVNLLGHTQYLIKIPELRDLNELRGEDGSPLVSGQICPLHSRTLEIAEKLVGDIAPFCTVGKLHVGLDESFHLGKCPKCRAEIEQKGLPYHFSSYVGRLHALTRSRGLRLGLWADMLNFIPEAIPQLPADVIAYDWYYYPFRRHPRIELYNFVESDLATPLRARGIEYWGCPMNGAFRYEPLPLFGDRLANLRDWWRRCERVGAAGMLITSWEAYRLALATTTVVDAAAANLWLKPKATANFDMLSDGFARVFGQKRSALFARLAEAADRYPFSGYARWESNDRWDGLVSHGLAENDTEETRFFSRAEKRGGVLPEAVAASLAFRAYLARREEFIRQASRGVWELRRKAHSRSAFLSLLTKLQTGAEAFSSRLQVGRAAARQMWRCSRDPKGTSQNERILDRDQARLADWCQWLRACRRAPSLVFETAPVCGRWQLIFTVVNFAPALQRVSVEQQQLDLTWKELHGRYTIEFQSSAAQRRARIKRCFSLPIDSPDHPLRLVVRGLGEVGIEDVVIANGRHTLVAVGPARFSLGQPAPRKGLPEITRRLEERSLQFSLLRSSGAANGLVRIKTPS